MSNIIINSLNNLFSNLAISVPIDVILLALLIVLLLTMTAIIVYQFNSFDGKVLFSSRNVLKFLRAPRNRRRGTLHYQMHGFPTRISKCWEKYFQMRDKKPSFYLNRQLISNYEIVEHNTIIIMKAVTVICTLFATAYAVCCSSVVVGQALLLPIFILGVGMFCNIVVYFIYTAIKTYAVTEFECMTNLLDFYSLNNFESILSISPKPKAPTRVEKTLNDQMLSEKFTTVTAMEKSKEVKAEELEPLAVKLSMQNKDNSLNAKIDKLMTTIALNNHDNNGSNNTILK